MKKLLDHIISNIIGKDNFSIEEQESDGHMQLIVKTKAENIGLLIGKQGRTIKAIRNIIKIKAVLENKSVNVSVDEAIS